MNRIQRLFEIIAGVSQEERLRWAQAQEIFCAPSVDEPALRLPACWRRKAGVRGARRVGACRSFCCLSVRAALLPFLIVRRPLAHR